jgi:hypothetical protein
MTALRLGFEIAKLLEGDVHHKKISSYQSIDSTKTNDADLISRFRGRYGGIGQCAQKTCSAIGPRL